MADQDYKSKVATCKKLKDEILMVYRPNHTKKLKNLILEMDIAMNVQLQKLATWNENLVMNSGVLISPLTSDKQSMKDLANSVDNEKDLFNYILSHGKEYTANKAALVPVDYKVHPSLAKNSTEKPSRPFLNNSNNKGQDNSDNGFSGPLSVAAGSTVTNSSFTPNNNLEPTSTNNNTSFNSSYSQNDQSNNNGFNSQSQSSDVQTAVTYNSLDPNSQPNTPEIGVAKSLGPVSYNQPTFGVSIEDVITFAGIDNVPLVVKKCIEIIETFGLDLEGIYRKSGNVTIVQSLRESIDMKFTNYLLIGNNIDPNNVIDTDIYCIASLLKLYFSSLPEPLLTNEFNQSFIETVKSLDENFIAKKLHHLVYNLPDGAYFTLRTLIFHLNKVAANADLNRMSIKNIAIIWGPVILNDNSMNPQDLSYKSKVVEELMLIANDIFDTDE